MILADVVPAATRLEVTTVLFGLGALGSLALIFMKLFVRKPPIEAEFVSRLEFTAFKTELKEDFQALQRHLTTELRALADRTDQHRTDMAIAAERRSGELHEKVNEIAKSVAAINERTKHL